MRSPAVRTACADRPPATRSAVTNGAALLGNVDMRSATARRFRDLVSDLTREHGGELSIAELGLIRSAAALTVKAEQLQAGVVRGDDVEVDELVRLSSEARRILSALRKAAPKPDKQDDLASYLASTYPEAGEAADAMPGEPLEDDATGEARTSDSAAAAEGGGE